MPTRHEEKRSGEIQAYLNGFKRMAHHGDEHVDEHDDDNDVVGSQEESTDTFHQGRGVVTAYVLVIHPFFV